MNGFKGTPGPWLVREIEGAFHNQKAYAIDFNEDQEQVVDYVYQKEDAYLIADAPRLYAALARLTQAAQDANVGYLDGAVAEGWEALESATSISN